MEQIDIVVIGAGVIGLAVSAEISKRNKNISVALIEKHGKFGQETSSRNSEVIHSGLYYPWDSLKTKLCIEGNKLLYEFCVNWGVPYQRIGKLVIAQDSNEISILQSLLKQGNENGVLGLEFLNKNRISTLEPNVKAEAGISVPSTGIIDSHVLMAKLESICIGNDVIFAYHNEVVGIDKTNDGYLIAYKDSQGVPDSINCKVIINCAGLFAADIARMLNIDVDINNYQIYPCKGEYFSICNSQKKPIFHLVYPPPHQDLKGLGVHITKSLDGRVRLGPNAFYVDVLDYSVNLEHREAFYDAAKRYLPFISPSDLEPDMAGIRPKLQADGMPFRDFVIHHEIDKNLPGVINLIGIESPGLTSCLSIARMVSEMIETI